MHTSTNEQVCHCKWMCISEDTHEQLEGITIINSTAMDILFVLFYEAYTMAAFCIIIHCSNLEISMNMTCMYVT